MSANKNEVFIGSTTLGHKCGLPFITLAKRLELHGILPDATLLRASGEAAPLFLAQRVPTLRTILRTTEPQPIA